MASITTERMTFSRILFSPIEIVLYVTAWKWEVVLSLPGCKRLANVLIEASADFAVRVLLHPAVTDAIACTIAEGMNKFLRQPDLDEHIKVMANTMSDVQPEIARKKGEEFNKSVAGFIQGMLSPRKDDTLTENLKTASAAAETDEPKESSEC